MKLTLAAPALMLGVAACGNPDIYNSTTLIGAWATPGGAQVMASPGGVYISLPCDVAVQIDHAVRLDNGSFSVMASVRGALMGGTRDTLTPVAPARISGTLSGDHLTVRIDEAFPSPDHSLTASFSGVVFDGLRGAVPGSTVCRA